MGMTREDVISWLEYISDDARSKADGLVPTNIEIACGMAIDALKAQEPRVMTLEEIKNADFCYLEVNGHDGVTPVLLKHFINDKYIHVTINGGSIYFFDITCDVEKLVRCWTSRPTDEQR